MVITFHGVITTEQKRGFNGRGFVQQWLYVQTNVWMRVGTPCTFICTDDVDHNASVQKGEIIKQKRLLAIPGHLKGVSHTPEDAIALIVMEQFRNRPEMRDWLYKLTQEGRQPIIINENKTASIMSKTCTCEIMTLMTCGCKCGAI